MTRHSFASVLVAMCPDSTAAMRFLLMHPPAPPELTRDPAFPANHPTTPLIATTSTAVL